MARHREKSQNNSFRLQRRQGAQMLCEATDQCGVLRELREQLVPTLAVKLAHRQESQPSIETGLDSGPILLRW
ncbi:MAG: hypothetical protein JO170_11990 [Verrucomicrobia bacterium]|nr:hypothetical protein [Verrucomicrobiota bacterium]